jgi:hypothetical protein
MKLLLLQLQSHYRSHHSFTFDVKQTNKKKKNLEGYGGWFNLNYPHSLFDFRGWRSTLTGWVEMKPEIIIGQVPRGMTYTNSPPSSLTVGNKSGQNTLKWSRQSITVVGWFDPPLIFLFFFSCFYLFFIIFSSILWS